MVNSYNVLYHQLPDYFRPIIEFTEILKAHGYALDAFDASLTQIAANNYIQTADEDTISDWEEKMGITYRFGDDLDYRRQRVLQKFNTVVPFSIDFLKDRLTELYGEDGYTLEVSSKNLTLKVDVSSDRYGAIDLLYDLLWDVVPAHVKIIANQETTNNIGGSRMYAAGFVTNTYIQTIGGSAT